MLDKKFNMFIGFVLQLIEHVLPELKLSSSSATVRDKSFQVEVTTMRTINSNSNSNCKYKLQAGMSCALEERTVVHGGRLKLSRMLGLVGTTGVGIS